MTEQLQVKKKDLKSILLFLQTIKEKPSLPLRWKTTPNEKHENGLNWLPQNESAANK